jgi:tripartite ATP-independent transporter DctP family solute receptor
MTINRRNLLKGAAVVLATPAFIRNADAAEFEFRCGSNQVIDHPTVLRSNEATERIFKETNGRLKITVYPSGQLGSDTDMLSQVRSGAIDMVLLSPLILATLVPVATVSAVCFAFPDADHVWKAVDGDLGKVVRAAVAKSGLVCVGKIFDNGFRVITTTSKPIRNPDDLKGVKMRVPPSPMLLSAFKALGAAPSTINWSELYSALQTKVVDGQENSLSLIEMSRIYEVQKHVSVTNHMWDGHWPLHNGKSFKSLPAGFQDIVQKNFARAAEEERADLAKLTASAVDVLKSKGMEFTEPDIDAFRSTLRKANWYAEWKSKLGPEAWTALEKVSGPL